MTQILISWTLNGSYLSLKLFINDHLPSNLYFVSRKSLHLEECSLLAIRDTKFCTYLFCFLKYLHTLVSKVCLWLLEPSEGEIQHTIVINNSPLNITVTAYLDSEVSWKYFSGYTLEGWLSISLPCFIFRTQHWISFYVILGATLFSFILLFFLIVFYIPCNLPQWSKESGWKWTIIKWIMIKTGFDFFLTIFIEIYSNDGEGIFFLRQY